MQWENPEVGIPDNVREAQKLEIHILRPGSEYWEWFSGDYVSKFITPLTPALVARTAEKLHHQTVWKVRVAAFTKTEKSGYSGELVWQTVRDDSQPQDPDLEHIVSMRASAQDLIPKVRIESK